MRFFENFVFQGGNVEKEKLLNILEKIGEFSKN